MDAFDTRLCAELKRDFPLCERPYAEIGARLGLPEQTVRARLANLVLTGRIARIGAAFAPHALGASTVAAMAVAPDLLHATAAIVNACAEVSHTCTREHHYNLWFVATACDATALQCWLDRIACDTGCEALSVPVEEEYFVDLASGEPRIWRSMDAAGGPVRQPAERRLAELLSTGLEFVPRPYVRLGLRSGGMSQDEVIARIAAWRSAGVIKRFGAIGTQGAEREQCNALCVWDVPDADLPALGLALAAESSVALCYRRPRVQAVWPYNLYCVMRGHSRAEIESSLAAVAVRHGLAGRPHELLFARRRYALRRVAGWRWGTD
ncbi:MAG: AsnC family transcriptional regulator [Rhodocyclaceae bacterium]|nr:AsnC family transcriptional regulator [Rhodocyclaceae bacterium]MBX3670981.1 AsnC family transcriptional regulator [Rhodocyclaceae bacterium]